MRLPQLLSLTPFSLISTAPAGPQVKLGDTIVVGREIPSLHQDFFGAIPYAKPPIGNLRLQPPVPTVLGNGTFDASQYGPACLQSQNDTTVPVNLQSEDCLTVNVFRPSGLPPNASLPVLFWTYGGGFTAGASFLYNGSGIVAQSMARGTPIIYVNFNYRLGPLGFPQGVEADKSGILNLGLQDQLTALSWVQQNIGAFGGDKSKVTAFGESAGAIMTSILYLNKPLDKLVRGTILQSGGAATAGIFNATHHEPFWQAFVHGVPSCPSLPPPTAPLAITSSLLCLRQANSTEIALGLRAALAAAALSPSPTFNPALDGPQGFIPDLASNILASGRFAKVPFVSGTNLDEGTSFTPRTIATSDEIRLFITATLSPPLVPDSSLTEAANNMLKLYPDVPALGSPYNTGNETFGLSTAYKQCASLLGDVLFQSQRRAWSQAASKTNLTSYAYLFTEPQPRNVVPGLGVFHSAEVPYVYGAPTGVSTTAMDPEVGLSRAMTDYWISFAVSGDPNDGRGVQRPAWSPYSSTKPAVMQLNAESLGLIPDDFRAEQISYINSIPLVFHHRRSH